MTDISKGLIEKQSLGNMIGKKFLEYANYVIKDRALPDARDGLKPVHRRILYDANELLLRPTNPYKKSARLVGDVLGKYHPHGDSAVYLAAVRMAQDFSLRYPLMDGYGNFGSIDGDAPAAMRYTEIRMSHIGADMMREDLKKETVPFIDSFDGSLKEPVYLPTMIPNLLANGSEGIAVGMATSIPPHNLTELYDACLYLIENVHRDDVSTQELMQFVKGPDFPTKGIIVDTKDLVKAFETGKGRITLRCKYEITKYEKDNAILITELPYQVNKAKLVEKIDELAKKDKIKNIKEVTDLSGRDGMKIYVVLKKAGDPMLTINKLLKLTDLQVNVSYNIRALVNDVPQQLGLKDCLNYFLAHCTEILINRTNYDLKKINHRVMIVEGILKATSENTVDEVISTIKAASNASQAIEELQSLLEVEEEVARYVWDMKINAISNVNVEKFETELAELHGKQKRCLDILNDQSFMLQELHQELSLLKEKYGDERLTQIETGVNLDIKEEDLIEDENLVVTISSEGLIKSVSEKEFNTQNRGGKGAKGAKTKDDEIIIELFTMNSKDDLLFITNIGKCHNIKAYKIPKSTKTQKGKSINNYISLSEGEYPVSIIATKLNGDASIVFTTRKGIVKRLPVTHLAKRGNVTKVITISEGDELVNALMANENDEMLIATALGMTIKIQINESQLRPMGRSATGVKGIKLKDEDIVIDSAIVYDDKLLLGITEHGMGKTTNATEWSIQKRGGIGTKGHKLSDKTGCLMSCIAVSEEDEIFVGTEQGQVIRLKVADLAKSSKNTTGSKIIRLNKADRIVSATIAPLKEEDEEDTSEETNE